MTDKPDKPDGQEVALCVVCDIRSFTEMQTRVHELVFESIRDHGISQKVSGEYKKYVEDTQVIAHQSLMKPILAWQTDKKHSPLKYVIKATGDGYMLAVCMTREGRELDEKLPLARELVQSVKDLAVHSEISKGEFGKLTKAFLESCGDDLGFNIHVVQGQVGRFIQEISNNHEKVEFRNTRFRLAAGVSLAYATFVDPPNLTDIELPTQLRPRLSDVSGYGVNLAFRLCDYAGRGYEDGEPRPSTPPVLLDRRIGRALRQHIETLHETERRFAVLPLREQLRLRGIDERWAYYVN